MAYDSDYEDSDRASPELEYPDNEDPGSLPAKLYENSLNQAETIDPWYIKNWELDTLISTLRYV